jgi:hypothetical protein
LRKVVDALKSESSALKESRPSGKSAEIFEGRVRENKETRAIIFKREGNQPAAKKRE